MADKSLDRAEKVLEDCARDGQFLLTMGDAGYPARLRNIYDPPLLLYGKGSLPLFDDEVAVTVVGSRAKSSLGSKGRPRSASCGVKADEDADRSPSAPPRPVSCSR